MRIHHFILLAALAAALVSGCRSGRTDAPGIRDFAETYTGEHRGTRLTDDARRALRSNKALDNIEFTLDESNGYFFLTYEESAFILELEMHLWVLPDGTRRFGVKTLDVDEDEMPVLQLAFYDYDAATGKYLETEVGGQAEMVDRLDLWDRNENLFLPRTGNDIKWGHNNRPEPIGWYRLQPVGSFLLEPVDQPEDL